jgi:hypothetical protein
MGSVSMEGLSTQFEQIGIKILKGPVMPPASSDSRRFFYQHGSSLLWVDDSAPPLRSLLVLWHYGANAELQLDLVCPKNEAEWFWQIPIPHPGAWPVQITRPPEPDDNLDDLLKPDTEEKKNKPN